MRLVYLYVQDNGPYKDVELNFDSNIRFILKGKDTVPYFEVAKDDVLCGEFFSTCGKKNMAVSALIARNGSGKTTAARILHQILTHDEGLGNFLMAIQFEENAVDVYYRLRQKPSAKAAWLDACNLNGELPAENVEPRIESKGMRLEVRTHPLSFEEEDYNLLREKLTMFYCTPLFTTQHPTFFCEKNYFRDLSTVGIMRMARRDLTHGRLEMGIGDGVNLSEIEAAETLRAAEVVDLLHKHRKVLDESGITLPLGLRVSRNAAAEDAVKDYWKSEKRMTRPKIVELRKRAQKELASPKMFKRLAKYTMGDFVSCVLGTDLLRTPCFCVKTFLYYTLLYWRDVGVVECEKDVFAQELLVAAFKVFFICQSGEDTLGHQENLRKQIAKFIRGMRKSIKGNRKATERVEALLYVFVESQAACLEKQSFRISFESKDGKERMVKLIHAHAVARFETPFLNFAFDPHVSSGEMAFLTFWGRIKGDIEYLKTQNVKIKARVKQRKLRVIEKASPRLDVDIPTELKHLLVFIDEAESALHPALQRQLVKLSIWFFETFMPNAKVHLIFASHSPILLSDIPKGNVVLLTRDKNDRISVASNESLERLNTFGANIFDLYRHSFFLEKGTVGAFAQGKIDGVIRKIFKRVTRDESSMIEGLDGRDRAVSRLVGDETVRKYLEGWIETIGSLC